MIGGLIFDILSHGFWGGIIFRKRSHYWLAFIFGILPDALAFGPLVILRIMAGDLITGKPGTNTIPPWVYTIYAWTHSLVIAGLIIIILLYINKNWCSCRCLDFTYLYGYSGSYRSISDPFLFRLVTLPLAV